MARRQEPDSSAAEPLGPELQRLASRMAGRLCSPSLTEKVMVIRPLGSPAFAVNRAGQVVQIESPQESQP